MIKLCGSASSIFAVAARLLRPPTRTRAWGETLIALVLMGILAFSLGPAGGAVTFSDGGLSMPVWREFLLIALIALFIPALFEELIFRAGLPALLGGGGRGDAIALALFIAWHPLQVLLGLPMAQPVFLDPAFLLLVAVLGLCCSLLYRRSASLLPAVILHWVLVIGWKAFSA